MAKCPSYSVQSSDFFNARLEELALRYDFDQNRSSTLIAMDPSFGITGGPNANGSYNLPTDYLRSAKGDLFYNVNGVIYTLFQISLEEYDALLKTNTLTSYPDRFATDVAQSPAQLFIYPPTSVTANLTARYQKQPTDVTTPATNITTKGWVPLSRYMTIAVAADLMRLTDDERQAQFELDAENILNGYFKMFNDSEGFSRAVKLDPARFRTGGPWARPTKLDSF